MIVNVIGLGDTATEFKPDGNITIGVNDVRGCDYQVCVDSHTAFDNKRFSTIIHLKVKSFFTQKSEWGSYLNFNGHKKPKDIVKHINLKAVHAHNNRWNEFIPSSNNSPFVACGVAYRYFNATEIYLYGVDFNDHPHLNGAMREQSVKDFQLLQKILNEKGCRIIPHEKSYLYGKI